MEYCYIHFKTILDLKFLSILVSPYEERIASYNRKIEYNEEYIISDLKNYDPYFTFLVTIKNENIMNTTISIKLYENEDPGFRVSDKNFE